MHQGWVSSTSSTQLAYCRSCMEWKDIIVKTHGIGQEEHGRWVL